MKVTRPPTPPDDEARHFIDNVGDFLEEGSPLTDEIKKGGCRTERLEVFTLTLQDLKGGKSIREAKQAGVRLLTLCKGQVIASDLIDVPEKKSRRMTSLSCDPGLASVFNLMQDIFEERVGPSGGDYELRLLSIPAILVEAFWLKSTTDTSDLIAPCRTAVKTLTEKPVYPQDEFLGIAQKLAERASKFHDMAL